MLTLNGTASEIWDMLKDGKSAGEIITALSEKHKMLANPVFMRVSGFL